MTLGKMQHPPSPEFVRATKLLTKRLVFIFTLLTLSMAGVIVLMEIRAKHAREEIAALAAEFVPGTSFSTVVTRLGPPTRTLTIPEEMRSLGPRTEPAFLKNSALHMFMRPGPPYRWLLVYTDRQSRKVSYATWRDI
jgi:hypothetical protein